MPRYDIDKDQLLDLSSDCDLAHFAGNVCVGLTDDALKMLREWRSAAEGVATGFVAEPGVKRAPQTDEELARTIARAAKELSERGYSDVYLTRAPANFPSATPTAHDFDVTASRKVSSDD